MTVGSLHPYPGSVPPPAYPPHRFTHGSAPIPAFPPAVNRAFLPVRRTEGKAIVALVLGLLSMACLGAVAGLPAIILGAMARREIDQSNGQMEGRGLAAAGIVSGLFGTGLGIVLVLWVTSEVFAPSTQPMATIAAPSAALTEPRSRSEEESAAVVMQTSRPTLPGTHSYGSLDVIDLDSSRPLRPQLSEIVARANGRTVVLQTVAPSSTACVAVAAALPDHRMQHALANVTLVRVDVEEYKRDLSAMKVETRSAPWFYKLDTKGAPTDAINADAWDANLPENMAPVLGTFVHRAAPKRHR